MRTGRPALRAALLLAVAWTAAGRASAAAAPEAASALQVAAVDPAGGLVVGARVTLRGPGVRGRRADTGPRGEARFEGLRPGTYRLTVEARGFEAVVKDVVVAPGGSRVEVSLTIARVHEEVQIEAEAGRSLDPRDAFATVLTPEQIADLPDDPDELAQVIQDLAGPEAIIRVNGFRGGRLPPKSQIREIRFRMDPFLAENHDGGMMRVDIVTQPGLGSWRGNAQSGYRDDALNARPAFSPEPASGGLRRLGLAADGPLSPGKSGLSLFVDDRHTDEARTVRATLLDGPFTALAPQKTDRVDLSAHFEQSLPSHVLRAEVQRRTQDQGGLGAGNLDLPERAYDGRRTEHLLRLSDVGTIGKAFTTEARLQVDWVRTSSLSLTDAPAVLVLGAFDAGGAQVAGGRDDVDFELAEDLGFVRGRHALRAGVLAEGGRYRSDDSRNAGGTFTFADLAAYRAGRPTSFSQRVGDPLVELRQAQVGLYLQDEVRLSKRVSLDFGVRQEWQGHVPDRLNLGPRLGLSAAVGRFVLRAGGGIFYRWMDESTYEQTLRLGGDGQTELLLLDPGYPDPFAAGPRARGASRTRYLLAPDLSMPTVRRASLGLERPLASGRLSLLYVFESGTGLLRSRNLNAPAPGTGRPDPAQGNVWQVESGARSTRHVVRANLALLRPASRTRLVLSYAWTHAVNESDGPFDLPAESLDLAAERGPAGDDIRHRLTALVGLRLPKGLRLDATVRGSSGAPYDVTTGRDENGDGVSNDRPAGLGRDAARGGARWDVGARASWSRAFGPPRDPDAPRPRGPRGGGSGGGLGEGGEGPGLGGGGFGGGRGGAEGADGRRSVTVYLQGYNVFNRLNPASYVGVVSSPLFGQPTSAQPSRRVEIGATVSF